MEGEGRSRSPDELQQQPAKAKKERNNNNNEKKAASEDSMVSLSPSRERATLESTQGAGGPPPASAA
eukprot:5140391-Alexandrium_andersonii.AAC.1